MLGTPPRRRALTALPTHSFQQSAPHSLTHSLTSLALKSAFAGGGGCIVEAVSPLRRPLWAKRVLFLDGRTAHVMHSHSECWRALEQHSPAFFFFPTSNAPIPANSQCSRGNAYPAWCVPVVTHGRTLQQGLAGGGWGKLAGARKNCKCRREQPKRVLGVDHIFSFRFRAREPARAEACPSMQRPPYNVRRMWLRMRTRMQMRMKLTWSRHSWSRFGSGRLETSWGRLLFLNGPFGAT